MKKISKFFLVLSSLFIVHYSLFPSLAYAICPVCAVAVGAGLGLSRYLGVDDTVSGLWVGAFILIMAFWLAEWSEKKFKLTNKFKEIGRYKYYISSVIMYAFTLIPLQVSKIIGNPFNRIWGIDKLIVGVFFGSLLFLLGYWLDKKERQIRGKQLFNFQKAIFPVSFLLIGSVIFYFITKI